MTIIFFLYMSQALKEDFPLSHVISPFTNQERREGMLLNLLIPFVLTVGSGSKGKNPLILSEHTILIVDYSMTHVFL